MNPRGSRIGLLGACLAMGAFSPQYSSPGVPHPIPRVPRTVLEPILNKKRVTFKPGKNRPKHVQRKKAK